MKAKLVSSGLLVMVFAAFLCAPAYSDNPPTIYTWTGIWRSISLVSLPRLEERFTNPKAKKLARKTIKTVDALHKIWKSNEDEIQKEYLIEATQEAKLLEAASTTMSEEKAYEVLKEVSADFKVKLAHCRKHPKKMGSAVNVEIKVKDSSGDVDGWQVFHVLRGLKIYANKKGAPLPKLSNPAKGSVSVGRHLIWAKKGDMKTKEVAYRIGFGKDDAVIELPIE